MIYIITCVSLLFNFTASASEFGRARPISSPIFTSPATTIEEEGPMSPSERNAFTSMPGMIDALRAKGRCGSVIVQAKNLTAVLWIKDGKINSGRYYWHSQLRQRFGSIIESMDVVIENLDEELPQPNLYKEDPIGTSRRLEEVLRGVVERVNSEQRLNCDEPLTS